MTFVPSCIYIPLSIIVHKSTFSGTKVLFTFTEQSWLHVANSDFEFGFQSNPWILDKWAAIYCTGDVPSCTEKCRKKALNTCTYRFNRNFKQAFHIQKILHVNIAHIETYPDVPNPELSFMSGGKHIFRQSVPFYLISPS